MLGIPKDPAGQKRMLIGALPLLIAFGYYQFVDSGVREEISALESEFEILDQHVQTARARANPEAIAASQRKLALYEEHVRQLEQLVPREEEVARLLYSMAERARDAGVEIGLMRPEDEQPGPFYTDHPHAMAVIGTYHDIGRFLADIGSLPRIVVPLEVRVQQRPNETTRGGVPRLQADFKLHTYVIPAKPEEAPAGAAQGAQ